MYSPTSHHWPWPMRQGDILTFNIQKKNYYLELNVIEVLHSVKLNYLNIDARTDQT